MKPPALLVTLAGLVAGCASPPQPSPPASPATDPAPATAPAPLPPPAPPPSAGPVSPERQKAAQKEALAARELLEKGEESQGRAAVRRSLELDPQNAMALSFQEQMDADPDAVLGRESFSYTLRANDTLSRLAERFLGDVHRFYILARYNDIKVPRQVNVGQTIRIPGRGHASPPPPPPPPPPPAPPPPAQPPRQPSPTKAPPPAPRPAPSPQHPPAPATAPRQAPAPAPAAAPVPAPLAVPPAPVPSPPPAPARAPSVDDAPQQVRAHTAEARAAFARQDLDGAAAAWRRVLAVEPGNATARLELERILRLKEKLDKSR